MENNELVSRQLDAVKSELVKETLIKWLCGRIAALRGTHNLAV